MFKHNGKSSEAVCMVHGRALMETTLWIRTVMITIAKILPRY